MNKLTGVLAAHTEAEVRYSGACLAQ